MPDGQGPQFVGTPGPGANVDLDLPLPGLYTGRRILEITDTDRALFRPEAVTLGIDYATALGVEKGPRGWTVTKRDKLYGAYLARRNPPKKSRGRGSHSRQRPVDGGTPPPPPPPPPPDAPPPPPDAPPATDDPGFDHMISRLEEGILNLPDTKWGGAPTEVEIDLEEKPVPRLFIIQVIGISSFLGDYGLGRTVKTFTLLPGESATISTRTWRATQETKAQGSSIIDSYDESSSERFADSVLSETTDTATQESTENWYAEAEANASLGIGGASVSGGGGGEYSSSTEEFARAVDETVSEHAAEASSHRESTVTSSSESSESAEDEEVIERTISNINVRRVLNFVFRELNQTYEVKSHLKDVKIAFSNGRAGSWREVGLSGLQGLLEEVLADDRAVDTVLQDLLRTIAVVFDADDEPVRVLEQVTMRADGSGWDVVDAAPGRTGRYASFKPNKSVFYRFKRGRLGQDAETENRVDGVVLKRREEVLRTDSVVVEALLGASDALDVYSMDLQVQAIETQRLGNQREELAQRIVSTGDQQAATLYEQVFEESPMNGASQT